jgi:hypothetical protein
LYAKDENENIVMYNSLKKESFFKKLDIHNKNKEDLINSFSEELYYSEKDSDFLKENLERQLLQEIYIYDKGISLEEENDKDLIDKFPLSLSQIPLGKEKDSLISFSNNHSEKFKDLKLIQIRNSIESLKLLIISEIILTK